MSGDTWHDHVDATWNPRGVTCGMIHMGHLCEWLTWSQVGNGEKKERKSKGEIKKKKNEKEKEWEWSKKGSSGA